MGYRRGLVLAAVFTSAATAVASCAGKSQRNSGSGWEETSPDSVGGASPDGTGGGDGGARAVGGANTSSGGIASNGGEAGANPGTGGAAPIVCGSCQDANRLDVYYAEGVSCVVLELVGGSTCDELNVGAGDWCLSTANHWWPVEECPPPAAAGPPVKAIGATGSVVGHDGQLSVDVVLAFPDAADQITVSVDLDTCDVVNRIAAPCPSP